MNAVAKKIEATSEAPQEALPQETAAEASKVRGGARKLRWGRGVLMLAVPLAFVVGGAYVWLTGGRYVSTDNAYVHQPIVPLSADVEGRIVEVDVAENQHIEKGTPVFKLDPAPYRIKLDQAEAALASARLSVQELRSAYAIAQAKLAAAEAIQDVKQREYDRQKSLEGRGASSPAEFDKAALALQAAENDVKLAQEGLSSAASALGGNPNVATDDLPSVQAALAQRESAQWDLDHTTITAPVAGVVSQTDSLNVGQYLSAGTMVASIVQSESTWIEANFKETQLEGVKVGQPVEVSVDAYPDETIKGSVESFGSATGSQFSLIPAQNATGNWVKVVQRLPVHIAIAASPDHPLRDGMSAEVSVDTGRSRLDAMR